MKMCNIHWAAMRQAIDLRRMSHLVPATGMEAVERTARIFEGEGSDADFDPLSAMHWNFTNRVMERVGLYLMSDRGSDPDGMPENRDAEGFNHVCPLCLVRRDFDAHNVAGGRCDEPLCEIQVQPGETPWDEQWVEGCADAMREYASNKGLIAKPS